VSRHDLDQWQRELDLAEADLRDRYDRAMQGEPTAQELRAFAAELDRLAADRDSLADRRDERARCRDTAALGRDVEGSRRDRRARDDPDDPAGVAADRFLAGSDRDQSAGDRADSAEDRRRAAAARKRAREDRRQAADDRATAADRAQAQDDEIDGLRLALNTRLQIGQAEGLLMARYGVDADAAFRMLVRLSQDTHLKLREVAARIVDDAQEQRGQSGPARAG
jgi:hypothetical protein